MADLGIKLDKFHYKALVLGTGMYESLLSAALAYKGQSSMNFDKDSSYSGAIKTCSMKEMINLFKEIYPNNNNHIFDVVNFETTVSEEEKAKMRGYNIDLQPRFLYSTSLTVNKMIEAGMDQYMDFRAISGISFYDKDSGKFVKVPISKGEIFSSGALSILEKRKLFKFLHTCTAIAKVLNNSDINVNSTSEFDKDIKIDEDLFNQIVAVKDDHFTKILDIMQISGKLLNLLLYVIVNYNRNVNESKEGHHFMSTKEFVSRIEMFIGSIGVHSNYPYLYTNYGTSDIPQGFSRGSAVNGSVFILNQQLNLQNIATEEGEDSEKNKYNFKLRTNLAGEKEFVTSELLVLNRDYLNILDNYTKEDIGVESRSLLRSTIIFEDKTKEFKMELPSFFYVFPEEKELENTHPVFVFATGETTSSTPANNYIFYTQTIIDSKMDQEKIKKLDENIKEFIKKKLFTCEDYREVIHASYVQKRRTFAHEAKLAEKKNLVIIDDDDFNLQLDDYFRKCTEYMKNFELKNNDLLFYHNSQDEEIERKYYKPNDDEEFSEDVYLKGVLDKLSKFKVEEKKEEEKAEEKVENKEENQVESEEKTVEKGEGEVESKEVKSEEKKEGEAKVEENSHIEAEVAKE